MSPVLVNQSYRMQRVTGQQRYATEISQRLLERDGFEPIAPSGRWAASTTRVWAWLQLVLPRKVRGSVLLSLTSRAPARVRSQVLVVHDLFVLTHPEWFSRRYVVTHAPLLRAQLRRAAAVVAVSGPVADELVTRFHGRVVVAPNAASVAFAQTDDPTASAAVLASRGLTAGEYLLTVGSLDPRKNLPALAAAYGQLPAEVRSATPLVVVGGGSAVFRQQSFSWPAGTVDAGYVTDDELRILYAHSRAVLFVSLAEGFGLPLVEATTAGAPSLVISDIPVFRWICGDGAAYVDPTSTSSIAAGIAATLADPIPATPSAIAFSWDESARVVAELCESIEIGEPARV